MLLAVGAWPTRVRPMIDALRPLGTAQQGKAESGVSGGRTLRVTAARIGVSRDAIEKREFRDGTPFSGWPGWPRWLAG